MLQSTKKSDGQINNPPKTALHYSEDVVFKTFGWSTCRQFYVVTFHFKGYDPDADIQNLVVPLNEWMVIQEFERDLERTALYFLMASEQIVLNTDHLS